MAYCPECRYNIAGGARFIENRSSRDDENNHGTHVARIAAAIDNEQGVAGVDVTIQSNGFQPGAGISLTSGAGPAPDVLNIIVQDSGAITATISIPGGGPQKERKWTVVVTNPDGSSASLVDGFTVSAKTASQGTDTKLKGMD